MAQTLVRYAAHISCRVLHCICLLSLRAGIMHEPYNSTLQVLHLAEQAFLEFLKDADKAFNMIIQHAARRRGHRDQSNSDSSSASLRDETVDNHVQQAAVVFTSAHVDFVTRLGDVMSRLPGGRAGCSLFALAASIRNQLTTAKS